MNMLFAAIREQHPGFEVMDIRLLANREEVDGQSPADLDRPFAAAVRASELKLMSDI